MCLCIHYTDHRQSRVTLLLLLEFLGALSFPILFSDVSLADHTKANTFSSSPDSFLSFFIISFQKFNEKQINTKDLFICTESLWQELLLKEWWHDEEKRGEKENTIYRDSFSNRFNSRRCAGRSVTKTGRKTKKSKIILLIFRKKPFATKHECRPKQSKKQENRRKKKWKMNEHE